MRLNNEIVPPVFGEEVEDLLASLTLWSVEQRYPANQPEPSSANAEKVLNFGRQAIEVIEKVFNLLEWCKISQLRQVQFGRI
ncbi:MAG: hypothetical protein HKL80_10865 [Acidimicrobiales bacterium]|nr:hypothetical protein [Acidimicrobiales bacterium]